MITEREKKALQLAKKAYGHFTQDALSIAKEIIALEKEMEADNADAVVIPIAMPVSAAALPKTNGNEVKTGFNGNEKMPVDPKTLRIQSPPYVAVHPAEDQALVPEYDERPY
jgi:hypothetical protein